jgi:hypothetical protein
MFSFELLEVRRVWGAVEGVRPYQHLDVVNVQEAACNKAQSSHLQKLGLL